MNVESSWYFDKEYEIHCSQELKNSAPSHFAPGGLRYLKMVFQSLNVLNVLNQSVNVPLKRHIWSEKNEKQFVVGDAVTEARNINS